MQRFEAPHPVARERAGEVGDLPDRAARNGRSAGAEKCGGSPHVRAEVQRPAVLDAPRAVPHTSALAYANWTGAVLSIPMTVFGSSVRDTMM